MEPKIFISYSWTSQAHKDLVKEWADRLLADGVDVILDVYDLKEGHDKFVFMEKMVTDPKITHVLIICDKDYAEKANSRTSGVGTESQIISKEVYDKVEQSKFIPLVCEFTDKKTPCLPIFLQSRIWIDFSSPEAVNTHWEQLIRVLHGRPMHEKPKLGKAPTFLLEDGLVSSSPVRGKFNSLRQAILLSKPGVNRFRTEFLDACITYADALRVRQRPEVANLAAKIVEDCGKLVLIRDHIVDWILLEAEAAPSESFSESLIGMLERLRELTTRPPELNSWSDAWFEVHKLFVYETFLYIVAALLRVRAFTDLRNVFTSHYLLPTTARHGDERFGRFDDFYAYSELLDGVLAPAGQRFYAPAAELVRRQSNREDLPFADIIQADLLVLTIAFITPETKWYPQLMHYSRYGGEFPFFVRASQHKGFLKLAIITGIDDVAKLRIALMEGQKRLNVINWHNFYADRNFHRAMNLENLDTIA